MNQLQKNEMIYNNSDNNKIRIKDELIYLINTLNSAIKSYYSITKQIILKSKENYNYKNNSEYIVNIEKQLYIFIQKAKDIFSKMKNINKQNFIKQQKNRNQLYNYCNNNFFYYSNAPTNPNTQNLKKIFNETNYRKISYKSPKTNSNFNINYINYNNYSNRHDIKSPRYDSRLSNNNNIFIKSDYICKTHINESNNKNKKQYIIPPKKLDLKKIINKEELLKNILIYLKQIKAFKGNIFYETNEAQNYKNIFYLILKELDKLIEILTKEKNKEYICLSTRNYQKTEIFKDTLNNKKNPKNNSNIKMKYSRSNSALDFDINQHFNDINTRNIVNEFKKQRKISNSQNIKANDINKSIDEQSEILISKNNENKNKNKEEKNYNKDKENNIKSQKEKKRKIKRERKKYRIFR